MKEITQEMVDALNAVADVCYGNSVEAGWWHDLESGDVLERNKGEMLCLIHSEVSEAMEGARKGLMDDHLPHHPMEAVELADALIRIFDYAKGHELDVMTALAEKVAYNINRSDHQLENRKQDGGKKF